MKSVQCFWSLYKPPSSARFFFFLRVWLKHFKVRYYIESVIHLAARIVQTQKNPKLARDLLQRRERIWLELTAAHPHQEMGAFCHLIAALAHCCGDYVLHRWEPASVKWASSLRTGFGAVIFLLEENYAKPSEAIFVLLWQPIFPTGLRPWMTTVQSQEGRKPFED